MSKPFITTAFKKGDVYKLRNRKELDRWMQLQRDGEFTVMFDRLHARRSAAQNALYHVAYVKPLAEAFGWTHQDMHEYLRDRFMPPHKRKTKTLTLVNRRTGEVIDEKHIDLSSTTHLDKNEWSDFLRDIGVWAHEQGVDVGSNSEPEQEVSPLTRAYREGLHMAHDIAEAMKTR